MRSDRKAGGRAGLEKNPIALEGPAGKLKQMRRLRTGLRRLWAGLLVAWVGAGAQAAEALNPKQLQALEATVREKFSRSWPELDTNQLTTLRVRAEAHEKAIRERHSPGGLIVSLRYADTNTLSSPTYEAVEDSVTWTGFYLTALAYRFIVLRDGPVIPEIRRVLEGVERLTRVSGRDGYVPRFAGAANDPAFRPVYAAYGGPDPARPGFGRLAFAGTGPGAGQVWLAGPSTEAYAGLNLGLALTHKLIRDLRTRQAITNIVESMMTRLNTDGWRLDDGKGNVTFVDPLLRAALLRTAATLNGDRYGREYEARLKDVGQLDEPPMVRFGELRPTMLAVANYFAIGALETNQSRRLLCQDRVTKVWRRALPQLNSWMAVAYANSFDTTPRDSVARATLQGGLMQYPDPPRWAWCSPGPTRMAGAGGAKTVQANGREWLAVPALVSDRIPTPFLWAESAHRMNAEQWDPVAHSGVDYLVAFWMARDASLVPSEDTPPEETPLLRPGRPRPASSRTTAPAPR